MKLSILIPIYNDKDYIQQTIDQIRAVEFPIPYEIIAVDDASTDGSKEILESISGITKIFHESNTGKGGAIITGLQHASGDIIAVQDDDCEYDPVVLPQLIEPILRGEADVVYGSRFLQKNEMFFIQRLENTAITKLSNFLLGRQLTDIETGHKVFHKDLANKITLTKKGFEFDMEITVQFILNGARIKELPTRYKARSHAQGKKITYKDGIRSIITLFKLAPLAWVKKIFLTALFLTAVFLPRTLDLGSILTVDEPLWLSRGQTFINGFSVGNFAKTLVAGQPGVTTAWLIGLTAPWLSLTSGQMAIGVTSGLLILIITYFFHILLGKKWGVITGLFLALDPFLIAHSRIAHTDALIALFYLASVTSLLAAFKSDVIQKRYVVMSAILGAFAILTKIFGIILVPTAIVIITYSLWARKNNFITIIRIIGLWIATCCIAAFLAWPALWTDSSTVFDYLFSRASLHAEGTRSEETTSAPMYYLRETIFRLSVPVSMLLPFAALQWRTRKYPIHSSVTLILMLSGLVFALVLNNGSDKSDRYILFTHLTLLTAAPLGLRTLASSNMLKQWSLAIIAIPIVYLAADDTRLHPYYLAHYNRLYKIEADHKLGWGEGLEQAAKWLEVKHPNAKVLSFYPRVFEHFYTGDVETIMHINDAMADYAVLYRSMFERGENSSETDILKEFLYTDKKPQRIIYINNLPYVWIYQIN